MDFKNCTVVTNNRKVVVKEYRSSFELVNNNQIDIEKIKVDDCLIKGSKQRCDWLLVAKCEVDVAHYVELKGCDLKKAVSQLGTTLSATARHFKHAQKKCYAVTTRVPRQGPTVQRLAKMFYRKHSVPLLVNNIRTSVKVGTCAQMLTSSKPSRKTMNKKFYLMVRGKNYAIEADGEIKRKCFYQNLFIEAEDCEAAKNKAKQIIRSDQSLSDVVRNCQDDPPRLFVEEIQQLESFDDSKYKDQERVFYSDDESEDTQD